ncbi:MAG: hypothetical protein LDL25_03245 [Hyphomicrobiales bacterium]|nr:hypothetical protein [Hyphomicrobiales bacterium]MCA1998782.1 hypothetical protein [Hyphomicrobiales bacterium]
MVQNVSAASAASSAALAKQAQQQAKAAEKAAKAAERAEQKAARIAEREARAAEKAKVPTIEELNQRAATQRQQIAAGLYDRSLTLGEGTRTLRRQDAIQAYAAQAAQQAGGPTDKDLRKLARKLDNADKQIAKLQNNDRGANLSSIEAIDGKDLDTVQDNLLARIRAGIHDGSLTKDEAETLLARQREIAAVEEKLRASDGKLTAGEQKVLLDDLRKTADQINAARRNGEGVNVNTLNYAEQIDKRQAALEKQLDEAIKLGSITAEEADQVRSAFEKAAEVEIKALANGRVDWREHTLVSNALNSAEIVLYDLQRNDDGVKLEDSYVDVKYIDQRQAQQLESITRGIDNGWLTNDEAETLLQSQRAIQALENKLDNGGLTRAEYLQLQTELNNFALLNANLQGNKDRWTGIFTNPGGTPATGGGSSNGTPVSGGSSGGGNGNGSGGGTPVTGGGTGNGSGNGSGGGTPVAGGGAGNGSNVTPPSVEPPVVTPPAVEPPKADTPEVGTPATAKPAPAEETRESVTKPTEAVEENANAGATAEAAQPVLKALEEIRDRFGEWMTGMMRERTGTTRALNDRFREQADALREELAERDGKRREAKRLDATRADSEATEAFPVRDAETSRKIGAYRAAAPVEPVLSGLVKKIA